MANNRMILVNTATGQRLGLAKHYVGHWYVSNDHILDTLSEAFDEEVEIERCDGSTAFQGSCDWRIEYEHVCDDRWGGEWRDDMPRPVEHDWQQPGRWYPTDRKTVYWFDRWLAAWGRIGERAALDMFIKRQAPSQTSGSAQSPSRPGS